MHDMFTFTWNEQQTIALFQVLEISVVSYMLRYLT